MDEPSNFIDTVIRVKSADKLKLQLSSSSGNPLIKVVLTSGIFAECVTIVVGGGSNQVMLPPSEI